MSNKKEKILILCVDRDNDIGAKTGLKAPIIGRTPNLEAALLLATNDPEESDANAIFGAIRAYDSASSEPNKDEYQIASITGSELGGLKADKEIKEQLIEVLNSFPADNVILVTDGFGDEAAIPIIQSRVPLLSVRRIIVRHSKSIEESWALFFKYLRILIEDPYYSRWILGVPGTLLIALSLLWYYNQLVYGGIVFLFVVGGGLLIKGFNIDKKVVEILFPSPPNLIRLFTTVTALILVGLDIYQTYGSITEILGDSAQWLTILPIVIGYVLKFAVDLATIASCIFLVGLGVYFYFMRDSRLWWTIIGIVATIWMRQVALSASTILLLQVTPVPNEYILNLILMIGLGIASTVITILITMKVSKLFMSTSTRSRT